MVQLHSKYPLISATKAEAGTLEFKEEVDEKIELIRDALNTLTTDVSSELNDITTESGYDSSKGFWTNTLVQGVKTKVYTKYFTGTTDGDATTNVAHGANLDKIIHFSGFIWNSDSSKYDVYDFLYSSSGNNAFAIQFDATNLIFAVVGVNHQSQKYRIRIDYHD